MSTGTTNNALVLNPSGGNVGVGTTNPQTTLHVNSSGVSTSSGIISNRYYLNAPGDNMDTASTTDNVWGPWYGMGYSPLNNPCVSGYNGVELRSGNGNFILTSGGNVGVGTTAPASKLEVNGSFSVANNSVFGGGGQVYMSGNYLDSGGVTRPNLLLNVVDTYARNSVTFSNGSLASIGTVYGSITHGGGGTSYNTSSDYRLKHNITPLTSSLQRIMLAKPCSFTYISDQNNKIHEGFIAHEIKEVVSASVFGEKDSVNSDGSINSQQFDASKLIPLAIGSIQELSNKLDATQQQLADKSVALDSLLAWAQTMGYPASS